MQTDTNTGTTRTTDGWWDNDEEQERERREEQRWQDWQDSEEG